MRLIDRIKKPKGKCTVNGSMEEQLLQNDTNDKRNFIRDDTAMDKAKDNMVNTKDCNAHSHERNEQVRQQSFKVTEKGLTGSEPQQCSDFNEDDISPEKNKKKDSFSACEKIENDMHSESEAESNVDRKDDYTVNEDSPRDYRNCDDPEKTSSFFTSDEKLAKMESKSDNSFRFEEIKDRYVIGDIAGTFKQVPLVSEKKVEESFAFKRHDIVADIAKIDNLLIMGASLRGESHFAHKTVRQDSFVFDSFISDEGRSYAIAVISDGVGNSSFADDYSDFLVNYSLLFLKETLKNIPFEKVDWNTVSENIWNMSVNYCYKKTGLKDISKYVSKWAATLEFIVLDSGELNSNPFIHVTLAGDGGDYLIDEKNDWYVIKEGKTGKTNLVSNGVRCLPQKPESVYVKHGSLEHGQIIFIVTDGIGDGVEIDANQREYFGSKLRTVTNISEFIKVLHVAIKGMDDDKTGILIKHF